MDKIIEFHDEKHIFMGGKPNDLKESYRKLCLVLGNAPESFSTRGRREYKDVKSKKGPRNLKPTTVVSSLFKDRYCSSGSVDLSVNNVTQLIEDLDGCNDIVRRKWSVSQTLSPLQLLTALRERMAAEEPRLVFNYFGMQNRSTDLLRDIKAELNDKFVQYFGSKYLEDDNCLAYVVAFIFNIAIGSAASARQIGLDKGGAQVVSKAVMRAADVMEAFTDKKGSVGCKELRVFCKRKQDLPSEEDNRLKEKREDLYWFALDEFIDPKAVAALELGMRYS